MAALIDSNRLFQLYRDERMSNALLSLPEDFEGSLSQMVADLGKKQDAQAQKELESARRNAISLIQLRRKKLILRAASGSGGAEILGAAQKEMEFFAKVRELCKEEDEWVDCIIMQKNAQVPVHGIFVVMAKDVPAYKGADGKDYGPYSAGQKVQMPKEEAQWMASKGMAEIGGKEKEALTEDKQTRKIKIITDIPSHRGLDSNTYGPFEPEQVVELPAIEADMLVSKKLAESA